MCCKMRKNTQAKKNPAGWQDFYITDRSYASGLKSSGNSAVWYTF